MTGKLLTSLAIAAALLIGAVAPAAAYDSNYFEMLRERDSERGVVVGMSFRLGGARAEAPRFSLGFARESARAGALIDVSAYRFAPIEPPIEPMAAPVVFADEAVRAAPAPRTAAFVLAKAAPVRVQLAMAHAPREPLAKPDAGEAPVLLAAAPLVAAPGLAHAVLPIDNPHPANLPANLQSSDA